MHGFFPPWVVRPNSRLTWKALWVLTNCIAGLSHTQHLTVEIKNEFTGSFTRYKLVGPVPSKNVFHEKMITWRALCNNNTTQNVNSNVADCVAKVLLWWFYPILRTAILYNAISNDIIYLPLHAPKQIVFSFSIEN